MSAIDLGLILLGYLVGSIPFGFLAGKMRGIDIRTKGSGNIGATNAGRVLGWKIGIGVFALDFLKGAIPPALSLLMQAPIYIAIASGLAAFFGHLLPIWLKFKGGKGVAVGAGVAAVVLPIPFLMSLAVWILFLLAFRTVSISSIAAALVLAGTSLAAHDPFGDALFYRTLFGIISGVLVVLKHLGNIQRLLEGTENQIAPSRGLDGLARVVHIGSMGAWVGIGWFFTFVVGLGLFATFGEMATVPGSERIWWLPLPTVLEQPSPGAPFPDPLRKEQGSLIAGQAVSVLFPPYFQFQFWLALSGLTSALAWRAMGKFHRRRIQIVALGFLLVLLGWALEKKVGADRHLRNQSFNEAIITRDKADFEKAAEYRKQFNQLHGMSVILNLITLVVATGALALAAFPPPLVGSAEAEATAAEGNEDDETVNLLKNENVSDTTLC